MTLRDIGNDLSVTNVFGTLQITDVGDDMQLAGIRGTLNANDIGGDLQLLADLFPGRSRINVSGECIRDDTAECKPDDCCHCQWQYHGTRSYLNRAGVTQ